MIEPAPQFRGGGGLFGPEIDLRILLRETAWPEPLDENAAAGTAYLAALEKHANDPLLHLRLGVLSYRNGDLTMAESYLLRSWDLSPGAESSYYLGELFAVGGRARKALSFLVEAVARESRFAPWRSKATVRLQKLAEDQN